MWAWTGKIPGFLGNTNPHGMCTVNSFSQKERSHFQGCYPVQRLSSFICSFFVSSFDHAEKLTYFSSGYHIIYFCYEIMFLRIYNSARHLICVLFLTVLQFTFSLVGLRLRTLSIFQPSRRLSDNNQTRKTCLSQ